MNTIIINGLTTLAALRSAADIDRPAAMDIETTVADNPKDRQLVSVAVTWDGQTAFVIPPEWMDRAYPALRGTQRWIFHNGLFDVTAMKHFGYGDLYYWYDTMGAQYLLNPDEPKGLQDLAIKYLGFEEYKNVDYKNILDEDFDKVAEMNALDACLTWKLYPVLENRLTQEESLAKIFRQILMPANRAFAQMSYHGIPVDRVSLDRLTKTVEMDLEFEQDKLNHMVGRELNVNSSKQVAELLYEERELPILERTAKTGNPSSGAAVLQRLAVIDPVAAQINKVRKLRKQLSAFLYAYPPLIKERNGRAYMHPTISPMRVVTGRTKASGPNIQQVPRDKDFRNIFGGVGLWIKADYSQIELRVAAHVAQEEKMIDAYRTGTDMHRQTAKLILGDDSDEARQIGKVLNFGLLYGAGSNKLLVIARDQYGVDLSPDDAERYHREFFETYDGLARWHATTKAAVRRDGYIRSPLGRVRYLPGALGFDDYEIWAAEREALNMPIQSMASDLLLGSLVRLTHMSGCRPVAAVHDEIDFVCRDDYIDVAEKEIRRVMEDPSWTQQFGVELSVPLDVDIEVGSHWGNVE